MATKVSLLDSLKPLAKLNHLASAARIAVACSGGKDSIALLHAAVQAGLKPIALHINHNIHADAAQWSTHVAQCAALWGAGFDSRTLTGLSADMPSLEAAARSARHAALSTLCAKHGVTTLLLAHHANDQAETVLLNLLRGTGLTGVGMPTQRTVENTLWLRPWLNIPRLAIEQYASVYQLQWIEDPSNTDTTLRRNAVRHTLWPVLESVEPRALPSLTRFAGIAQGAGELLHALALRIVKQHLDSNNTLDWHAMVKGEAATVQLALLRAWLAHLNLRPPSTAQGLAMLDQLNARYNHSAGDGLRCHYLGLTLSFKSKRLVCTLQSDAVNSNTIAS